MSEAPEQETSEQAAGQQAPDQAGPAFPPRTGLNPDSATGRWLGTAAILSAGLVMGGYLLGNGLLRAKEAERAVTCAVWQNATLQPILPHGPFPIRPVPPACHGRRPKCERTQV